MTSGKLPQWHKIPYDTEYHIWCTTCILNLGLGNSSNHPCSRIESNKCFNLSSSLSNKLGCIQSHLRPKIPISAHLMQACNNFFRDVGWSERLKCTIFHYLHLCELKLPLAAGAKQCGNKSPFKRWEFAFSEVDENLHRYCSIEWVQWGLGVRGNWASKL